MTNNSINTTTTTTSAEDTLDLLFKESFVKAEQTILSEQIKSEMQAKGISEVQANGHTLTVNTANYEGLTDAGKAVAEQMDGAWKLNREVVNNYYRDFPEYWELEKSQRVSVSKTGYQTKTLVDDTVGKLTTFDAKCDEFTKNWDWLKENKAKLESARSAAIQLLNGEDTGTVEAGDYTMRVTRATVLSEAGAERIKRDNPRSKEPTFYTFDESSAKKELLKEKFTANKDVYFYPYQVPRLQTKKIK